MWDGSQKSVFQFSPERNIPFDSMDAAGGAKEKGGPLGAVPFGGKEAEPDFAGGSGTWISGPDPRGGCSSLPG